MQTAPSRYTQIYEEGNYDVEYKVNIDGVDYDQAHIWNMKTSRALFTENTPFIGNALVGQIDLTIDRPDTDFSRMACIKPSIRLVSRSNRNLVSGWLQKGEFYIDTRPADESDGISTIEIKGYDTMRKANKKYPSSTLTWNRNSPNALQVVYEIAGHIFGVPSNKGNQYVDSETIARLGSESHIIPFPAQYTMAEVLGSIGTIYGGNWIVSDVGKLKLVGLMDLPEETYYLVTERGNYITFGGTRILLRTGV